MTGCSGLWVQSAVQEISTVPWKYEHSRKTLGGIQGKEEILGGRRDQVQTSGTMATT